MKILALSTARKDASVALLEDEHVLCEVYTDDGRQHAETVMLAIDRVLKDSHLPLEELDLFACATGPGSFTGLRVGMATVKGLALVMGRPIVGISSLEAIAFAVGVQNMPICVLMLARPGFVYGGLYCLSSEGETIALDREKFCSLEQIFDPLPKGNILFVGDGATFYRQKIEERLNGQAIISGTMGVQAKAVGILGYRKFKKGKAQDPLFIIPHYIQASSAETKVDKECRFELRKKYG
ncbi:MAG: tRNA (adenosine(37)-N6)-threonylcarbamoyltransferase complex dimerization subunit type 1 TsaB [Syntrophales bacterium]|nr:tRNA (adenosine(37)-N6)-threonylcarbamoyltransferase complex dimerization subunit type 1 TsaB [Syntrophales bacterium]